MSDKADSDEESQADEEASSEDAEVKPEQSKAEDKPRKASATAGGRSGKAGRKSSSASEERARSAQPAGWKWSSERAALVGALALAAGAAGGWFGHQAQAKAKLANDSAPAAAGSGTPVGPCGTWQKKICESSGDASAACEQAKGATDLLTTAMCEIALDAVPATLAKMKASRAPCESLVAKLCKEVPPNSPTCAMVKERSASFPRPRCEDMLVNYAQVSAEIRMLEEQGALRQGASPHGVPAQGVPPHGAPPIAMPMGADDPLPP